MVRPAAGDYSRRWLAAACIAAAAVIVGAPFIGQLRGAVRHVAGSSFVPLMAVVVGGSAVLAISYALFRIRERRLQRYASLCAAAAIGVGYAYLSRTGNVEVDAVERFHFVEYGVLTILFQRAWRRAGDGSAWLMPLLAGLMVGICEEWLQWFVPARVGEVRDVLLNFFAITCGLLFCVGLDGPQTRALALTAASRRRVSVAAAMTILLFGGFFHSVHLGYEIADAEAGVFRSRYSAAQLAAEGADRVARWRQAPPMTWSRLSREDQYMSEGVMHVQERNELWAAGHVLASRHENLILETYYAPLLDTPSYLSPSGLRWSAAQRADADSRTGPGFIIYESTAHDYPIVLWPKWAFWLVITLLASLALLGIRRAT